MFPLQRADKADKNEQPRINLSRVVAKKTINGQGGVWGEQNGIKPRANAPVYGLDYVQNSFHPHPVLLFKSKRTCLREQCLLKIAGRVWPPSTSIWGLL